MREIKSRIKKNIGRNKETSGQGTEESRKVREDQ